MTNDVSPLFKNCYTHPQASNSLQAEGTLTLRALGGGVGVSGFTWEVGGGSEGGRGGGRGGGTTIGRVTGMKYVCIVGVRRKTITRKGRRPFSCESVEASCAALHPAARTREEAFMSH